MSANDSPNHLLTQARCALRSPSGSGRELSRQELAEAVNLYLWQKYESRVNLDGTYIGHLEQGNNRWPGKRRREAFRSVLGVETDAEIGFYIIRGLTRQRPTTHAVEANPAHPPAPSGPPHQESTVTVEERPTDLGSRTNDEAVRLNDPAAGIDISDNTFISIPVQTGNGVIAYMITRRALLATLATNVPALAFPEHLPFRGSATARLTEVAGLLVPSGTGSESEPAEWSSYAAMTRLLASQRQIIAPEVLLDLVETHRDSLIALFKGTPAEQARLDIGNLIGETSVVASRLWSAKGNRALAIANCAFTRQLADKLKNPVLGATARIFESNLHSEAATLIGDEGDVLRGLRLLDEAASVEPLLSPAARARIAAEQAQLYAVLKLERECEQALNRARTAVGSIDDTDRTGLFSDWSPARLLVYEGTCELFLGKGSSAVETLTHAARLLDSEAGNLNVLLAARVDLASAYAESGDLAEGCKLLGETYSRMIHMGNRRGVGRARLARNRLARWEHEREVRELDELMSVSGSN